MKRYKTATYDLKPGKYYVDSSGKVTDFPPTAHQKEYSAEVPTIPAKKGFRMRLRHVGWIVTIALFGGLLWFIATTFWQLLHMK